MLTLPSRAQPALAGVSRASSQNAIEFQRQGAEPLGLTAGQRLGSYAVVAPLGAGGMGEVYRVTDTNLGRDVAIKVLPEEVAKDADRMARVRREANLLASLNHPNIAAIYGLEEADGRPFLVLELAFGEDLSERLKRGAIPVDEAIAVAKQAAEPVSRREMARLPLGRRSLCFRASRYGSPHDDQP